MFGSEFDALMKAELQFAAEMNGALRQRAAELDVKMGTFLDQTRLRAVAMASKVNEDRETEFQDRWREALAGRSAGPLRVLEFACGSANDYRYMVEYGLAPLLDYAGIDLNVKNVENASRRFPDVRFEVGSILDLPHADHSFDIVLAFDIFEHLSLAAMERALTEAIRVSRKGLVLAFFIMTDSPEHLERTKGTYHWKRLSAAQMQEFLRRHYESVSATHIRTLMREEYAFPHSYNPNAYTVIAEQSLGAG